MPEQITQRLKDEATAILDRMREPIENGMLHPGYYVTPFLVDSNLAESSSLCGGHQVCLIGDLYLAGGVRVEHREYVGAHLPGVLRYERDRFMRTRPALHLAYEVLNRVAVRKAQRMGLTEEDIDFENAAEDLFEVFWGPEGLGPADVKRLITAAKREVTKTPITA